MLDEEFDEDDLFKECLEIVDGWKPKEFSSELEYKHDLRKILFNKLNEGNDGEIINVKVEDGRTHCDIAVGRKVGIELKFGKNGKIKKQKINELYGQVVGHIKEYPEGIIVILVGDVNEYTKADVEEKLYPLYELMKGEDYPLKLKNKSYSKVKAQTGKEDEEDEENDEDEWGNNIGFE